MDEGVEDTVDEGVVLGVLLEVRDGVEETVPLGVRLGVLLGVPLAAVEGVDD